MITLNETCFLFVMMTGGQGCFDAENNSCGFEEFLPLSKLWRYLDGYRLTIIAELDVIPAVVLPEEPAHMIIKPSLSCNQADDDASVSRSQVEQVSCQLEQKTENHDSDENGGKWFNTVASVKEIQPVKETTNVNGFEVLSSQVIMELKETCVIPNL